MKKQTAVEWLEKELEGFCLYSILTFTQGQELRKRLKQAKEMEKQQMALFYEKGTGYGICVASQNADDHPYPSYKAVYNELYETKE